MQNIKSGDFPALRILRAQYRILPLQNAADFIQAKRFRPKKGIPFLDDLVPDGLNRVNIFFPILPDSNHGERPPFDKLNLRLLLD
ncbi:hypothetical protein [Paenibacillus konkukensis]|uniref:hypothetical protein n=1 Tax=Paenibacillus konkukensis TaxID=2020716 RepID=UPI00201E6EB0|nr:hypothetical protein [Paenibacillus konkukensis]